MRHVQRTPLVVAGILALLSGARAQQPAVPAPAPTPTFRASVDLITSDVVVRNKRGEFQADLAKDDFEIYEDGVKQAPSSFVLVHGGRAYTSQAATPAPVREGIILPPARPTQDASGRIIMFVIDDLHLDFDATNRVRELFRKLGKELVHEGDLFGIVSTGTSSIAVDLTYDRARMDEAAGRISGSGLKPDDIVQESANGETPQEVMHREHVAISTMYDLLSNLESTHNRRKAIVVLSNGYDFDPYATSRNQKAGTDPNNPVNPDSRFADTDLTIDINELTREANRANAIFYPIDPRGLVAGQPIDQHVDPVEWEAHLRKEHDTLRSLAEQTGGFAVVNTNDIESAIKRIDAETSDYYVLGYYSSNPDPTQKRRLVEIKVKKPDPSGGSFDLTYRHEYTLRPPTPPLKAK
jgi:VWFA-related protein